MRADLHSHTTASDGALTPSELVLRAGNAQIDLLAITDHDTIDGLAEAHRAAQGSRLRVINGIEFSCSWEGFEIHVVGLDFDVSADALLELIAAQTATRIDRAARIADRLSRCGVEQPLANAQRLARNGAITRAHFARVLLEQGKVATMEAAFKKYLRKGKRAYVAPGWCEISEAVSAINAAGGVAVLAHPMAYQLSKKWLRQLVEQFALAGGQAIEVAQPQHLPNDRKRLAELANEYNLSASAGSDFHRPDSWAELGRNIQLPEHVSPVWNLFSSRE